MDVNQALTVLQNKGLAVPTKASLNQKILQANTGSLAALATVDPNVKNIIDVINAQKMSIMAAPAPVAVAQGTIAFSDGITFNFPATTTPKIFIDGFGIAGSVTGFARQALAAGGTYGTSGSDILGKILQGSPQKLVKLIATKADGLFNNVSVRLIHCTADGGTDYNKPLNFALGRSPLNNDDSVLEFAINLDADGYIALQVDTVANTDFALSMVLQPK